METTEETHKRPRGCYFDLYGWDEERLRTLTCENCPLPAMVCDYKGWAVLKEMAKRVGNKNIVIMSEP